MNKNLRNIIEKIIKYLFYLFVFLLPWQSKYIIRLADSNFNEISVYVSHLVLLLCLIMYLSYRGLDKQRREKMNLIWYFLAGFSLFVFLSFFFAPDKALAFYKYIILMLGLGLFYVLHEGFKRPVYGEALFAKAKIIYIFLTSIFLHVSIGIYQFLSQSTFAFKYLGLASHDPESLGVSVIETVSGRWLRAYGGFDHPNIFGGVLAVSIVLAAYLLAKKKLIRTKLEITESLFLFVFYFFSFLAILFTFSRSAWLALVLGIIALFFVFLVKKEKWALGRLSALFFFSLILTAVIFFSYQDIFETRINSQSRLEQISITERTKQVEEANGVLANNWLFGTGFGNYSSYLASVDLKENGIKKAGWEYQPVHNAYLLLWSESGLLALVFFSAFVVALIRHGRKEAFVWSLLLPLLVIMFFDHWLLSLPFGIIFLFFIFGLL